ncbi:MAG: hypothetical protein AVDCRST_MAG18-3867 [uncultured Thermomicrobiales bacterium]|uniref:IS481 family transposase n=1 Tax=uncultured Thermomicrobiales bacterium TaxID=1645740 RepID=A0A6J4VQX8_9BACT|nr:MAG: hypothetical protein AVDCRST_MAG18-3867 [uncultured Thermomicrobiales bacterium]
MLPCLGRRTYGTGTTRERPHDSGGRRAIQQSQASLKALAARHAINPKTVAKWRKRGLVEDAKLVFS